MSRLRDHVFGAIAAGDLARAEALCRERRADIAVEFPRWSEVPAELRSDPAALQRYAHCLITIARLFAERLGDSSLIERLRGPAGDNPLDAWQADLATARDEMSALRYAEATARLLQLLEATRELVGSGADQLRPVTLGFLGQCRFQQGDAAGAVPLFEQALAQCGAAGHGEGVASNLRNLFEVHRYLGDGAQAADHGDRLADALVQLGRTAEAARIRRRAAIARAGEPRNRVNAILEDSRQVELDELGAVTGPLQLVFERNRLSLRIVSELCRQGAAAGAAGRYDEALALFRAAAEADPHDPHPRYEEGLTLLSLRRYAEAVTAYTATEDLAPGWFHCRADLWLACELAAGRLPHTTFEALRALSDAPGDPASKLSLADAAIADTPGVAALHFHRALQLEQLGRNDDAFKALGAGLACDPEPDIRTRLLVHMALLLDGDQRRAILDEAADLDGNRIAAAMARITA